jgi:hypothetical protein
MQTIHETSIDVKFSLCLTNYALRYEDLWGSGPIYPRILELSTR